MVQTPKMRSVKVGWEGPELPNMEIKDSFCPISDYFSMLAKNSEMESITRIGPTTGGLRLPKDVQLFKLYAQIYVPLVHNIMFC